MHCATLHLQLLQQLSEMRIFHSSHTMVRLTENNCQIVTCFWIVDRPAVMAWNSLLLVPACAVVGACGLRCWNWVLAALDSEAAIHEDHTMYKHL